MLVKIKFIFMYMKNYWLRFCMQFLGTLITSLLTLIFPYLYGLLIDSVLYQKDVGKLINIVLLYGILFFISQFMYLPMNLNWTFLRTRFLFDIRKEVYKKFMLLPAAEMNSFDPGKIISIISNDCEEVMTLIVRNGFQQISNIMMLIISLTYIFYINSLLGYLVLLLIPINYFLLNKIKTIAKTKYRESIEKISQNTAFIFEILSAMEDIKLLSMARSVSEHFLINEKQVCRKKIEISKYDLIAEKGNTLISLGIKLLIFTIVMFTNNITVGAFVACMEYYEKCIIVFSSINKKMLDSIKNFAAIDRLIKVLNYQNEKSGYKKIDCIKSIEFKNVVFKYNKRNTISDISFRIENGDKVAIVGKSGEGKTTLIRLLLKYYEPLQGEILINGINVSELDNMEYRNKIGVSMQRNILFEESIRYNLSLDKSYDEEELYEILKKVDLYDMVLKLPQKLDTKIGKDGIDLSGGQKQRLCIARVILRDPELFILDEPTSSLDEKNADLVIAPFFSSDKTVICISHDAEIVSRMNKIIYIDKGKVAEIGTHQKLYDSNKQYRELFLENKTNVSKGEI